MESLDAMMREVGRRVRGRCCEKRPNAKKHGEVAFPTQVRYDIVFLIGPVIIISALSTDVQAACHIGKILRKH